MSHNRKLAAMLVGQRFFFGFVRNLISLLLVVVQRRVVKRFATAIDTDSTSSLLLLVVRSGEQINLRPQRVAGRVGEVIQ